MNSFRFNPKALIIGVIILILQVLSNHSAVARPTWNTRRSARLLDLDYPMGPRVEPDYPWIIGERYQDYEGWRPWRIVDILDKRSGNQNTEQAEQSRRQKGLNIPTKKSRAYANQ
ncbi:hypothetical protein RRG08_010197 [Elysia crispata]|uniref:Uncharacterized protein n=1 Tax=Elysia crispata TaxID=231223 RepID=A0AAE1AJS4_9GAST|nr:hypothetical protein RRG08_010197 [Elysia crispata]